MHNSLRDLAPPFEIHTRGRTRALVNPAFTSDAAIEDIFRLPEILRRLPGETSRSAGRVSLWTWQPSWLAGRFVVVRKFVHGGVLGPLLGDLFVGAGRMLRELRITLHARSHGVPTCRPVALRLERAAGPLVRAHYITERIENTRNLLEFCEDGAAASSAEVRHALTERIAGAIAAMHDAGICHADLNVKNILVRPGNGSEVFVIDFDKARLARELSLEKRLSNLVRLDRSVLKWSATRAAITRADRIHLLRHYLERYPQWGSRWKTIARKYRRRHLLHFVTREQ